MTHRILVSLRERHCDEAAFLWTRRTGLLSRPGIGLTELEAVDLRIEAHLDGVRSSGKGAWEAALASLADGGAGNAFVATVLALESKRRDRLTEVLARAAKRPGDGAGVASGFGWVSRASLAGVVVDLLGARAPAMRALGIHCCAMHGVDPGSTLATALAPETDRALRIRALRTVGRLGLVQHLPACLAALVHEDVASVAAWAAVLLGDRGASLDTLRRRHTSPFAQELLTTLLDVGSANAFLKTLAGWHPGSRRLARSIGLAGDTCYMPWLLRAMRDPALARVAGEAFSVITGLDLEAVGLTANAPDGVEIVPNDDPRDDRVQMDEDAGTPWPDVARLTAWWSAESERFPAGTRFFMGRPPDAAHCQWVLRDGPQRQRALAAEHLSLRRPGLALFNVAAPAWRQRRALGAATTAPDANAAVTR